MSILDRRYRGFRLVNVVAVALLIGLVLSVYLAKTIAGGERAQIAQVERLIQGEKDRIRLLHAEVSHLEQPSRIGNLATAYLQLAPLSSKRETTPEALAKSLAEANAKALAARPAPMAEVVAEPVAPPAAPVTASISPVAPVTP